MPIAEVFRAVLRTASPPGVVLLGAVATAQLDWQVAFAIWGGTLALGVGAALLEVRDSRRLVRRIRAMRDGDSGAHAEVFGGNLRELSRHLGQLESEVGRIRSGVDDRDRFLDGLLLALPMPVLTLNPDGRVTDANAAAAKLFQKTPPGHALPELTRVPACLQAVDAAGRERTVQTVQCRLPAQDGSLYQVSVHPFEVDAGDVPRRVVVCLELADSTPRETARTTFLANASHEFRTPLTAILGMVETLQGPGRDDPEVQTLYLDRLGKQASRMVTLVDDMIHLSAVEMSEALPPDGRVDLAPLAREVTEDLTWQAAVRSMQVKVAVPADPVEVTGDVDQLRQLLTNLLSNAIKHGREGGSVRVEVGPKPARITVTDDGEGIPPGETERVFERFYRSAQARNRRIPGHGLGLAIVKHVARRHGAALDVQSEPGVGCAISVTFEGLPPPLDPTVT